MLLYLFSFTSFTIVIKLALLHKGKVRTKVIPQTKVENVTDAVKEFIAPDSTMVTDEHPDYKRLSPLYDHKTVNHRAKEYVRGSNVKAIRQSKRISVSLLALMCCIDFSNLSRFESG